MQLTRQQPSHCIDKTLTRVKELNSVFGVVYDSNISGFPQKRWPIGQREDENEKLSGIQGTKFTFYNASTILDSTRNPKTSDFTFFH